MRHPRIVNTAIALLATFMLAACGVALASETQPGPNTNQVAYWCDAGAKFEPVDTPFEIPEPPEGFVWTLLVLKAGDENSTDVVNETYDDPQPGDFYSRDDGKDISHAILCMELVPVDTTEPDDDDPPDTTEPTDTTEPDTTEPDTTSVETTEPEVTNPPCPDCTPNTQAVTTTTAPAGSTTTTAPATTTTTVPVPAQTTTTTGPPLPITE